MQNVLFKKGLVFVIIALFTLTSVVPSIVGEENEYFYANQDIPVSNGGISGDYTDTFSSDDVYEAISERESGGKPSNRYSYLEHKWTFALTCSYTSIDFYIEAYHSANSEGDDFVFAYSTNDADYTDILTVTKTTDDDTNQGFSLPNSLSGTVYIRVKDTDQTPGRKTLDTVYIDYIYILAMTSPDTTPPVISNVASSYVFTNGIEIITSSDTAGKFDLWENQSAGWVDVNDIGDSYAYSIKIADTDNDGQNEVISVYATEMKIYEKQSGGWVKDWCVSLSQVRDVDVGDIDNDGQNEIVAGSDQSGFARAYEYNGSDYELIWTATYESLMNGYSVKIGDVTNDGKVDFLVSDLSPILVYENQFGTFVNTYNITGAGNNDNIDIGDADNDGDNEVIFCGADYKVHLVEWNDSGFEEVWDSGVTGSEYVQGCVIGDVDTDGYNEIVAGGEEMYIWENHSGGWSNVWSSSGYGGQEMKSLQVLDVDDDGKNEFVSADGSLKWYIWGHVSGNNYVEEYSSAYEGTMMKITAGDVDNDAGIQATISWDTDEPSDSVVNYGTTTELGNTVIDSSLVTNHQIFLNKLLSNTTYYFEVQSTDASDNTATDDNNGDYYTFTTEQDNTPPIITNVQTKSITHNSATITWDTDESSNSRVNYGTTTDLSDTEFDGSRVTYHSIGLLGLQPETTYYYEVESADSYGNTATDDNSGAFYTFTTEQAPNNVMHVYSIDMWYTQSRNKYTIYSKVKIVDASDNAVEGATVDIDLTLPNAIVISMNDITDSNGEVTFVYGPTPKVGTYTITVTDAVKSGWTYNPDDNLETSENLNVP